MGTQAGGSYYDDELGEEPEHLALRRTNSAERSYDLGQKLSKAVAEGAIVRAMGLLEEGADPGARDVDDRPTLSVAFLRADAAMARLLLSYGADPASLDEGGRDVLMLAAGSSDIDCMMLALSIEDGPKIDARDTAGCTALMRACLYGRVESARMLLSLGADPNAKTDWGLTTLMVAAQGGHPECVGLLLSAGADVEAVDGDGRGVLGRCKAPDRAAEVDGLLAQAIQSQLDRREIEEAVASVERGKKGKSRSGWL